jgi:ASC-1-like (ASCH) protein
VHASNCTSACAEAGKCGGNFSTAGRKVSIWEMPRGGTAAFSMRLGDPWFEFVASGTKIYEGRRWWKPTQKLQIGDSITFQGSENRECRKIIKNVLLYPTFEVALRDLPLEKVLPGVSTVAEGVAIYLRFVSLETQQKDGICMLELSEPDISQDSIP